MRPRMIIVKDGVGELIFPDREGFTKRPLKARVAQRRAKNKVAHESRRRNR